MSSFHERQKDLFNHLKEAEDQCAFSPTNKATQQLSNEMDRKSYKRLKHEMNKFRGRESIYKRPEANIRECLRAKTVPDHIKNPYKYKYYSLSDVSPDQISDATNTATALAFIREMEAKQAENTEMDQDGDGEFKKPTFHMSARIKKVITTDEEKVTFKNRAVVMPEYVVGVSQRKAKTQKCVKETKDGPSEKRAELKLQHLFEDDCDE